MEIKKGRDEFSSTKRSILKKFHMEKFKAETTPINPNEKLNKEDETGQIDEGNFRCLIGYLMYLTVKRPDILFVASILSRFMHCAIEMHL